MNGRFLPRFHAGALLAAPVVVSALAGCGGGRDSTTGKRVTLETRAAVEGDLHEPFTTSFGFRVRIESAKVALGALYYFDGEPPFVRNETPPKRERWRFAGWFEGVAHAHPGHYQAGSALGEMLVQAPVDLSSPGALGDGEGITGSYRSGRFVFAKAAPPAVKTALGSSVAVVTGTAQNTLDGAAAPLVHFRLDATFADVAAKAAEGRVEGCEFQETDVEGDGTVTVTFRPSVWLDLVDFSGVAAGTEDSPTVIAAGSVAQVGFALGLVQLTAYRFAFST